MSATYSHDRWHYSVVPLDCGGKRAIYQVPVVLRMNCSIFPVLAVAQIRSRMTVYVTPEPPFGRIEELTHDPGAALADELG
nr:hypothetical protein CFP56_23978 [Quercus suber]